MKKINASKQMYLKTIKQLGIEHAKVRNVDIANALGYSKPSVTNAVKKLVAEGFVLVSDEKEIILTKEGNSVADKLIEKNSVLEDFLRKIGVDGAVAKENACILEHVITDDIYDVIRSKRYKKEQT